jgi:biopolymer transport protein ExbB/TolQ
MFSNVSTVVQVLSVIIVITTILTLIVAVFSYVAFKVQQRRRPQQSDETADFFHRFTPDRQG